MEARREEGCHVGMFPLPCNSALHLLPRLQFAAACAAEEGGGRRCCCWWGPTQLGLGSASPTRRTRGERGTERDGDTERDTSSSSSSSFGDKERDTSSSSSSYKKRKRRKRGVWLFWWEVGLGWDWLPSVWIQGLPLLGWRISLLREWEAWSIVHPLEVAAQWMQSPKVSSIFSISLQYL